MSKFIRQEAPALPWGSTLLVIAAQPTDELLSTLSDLRGPGRTAVLIKIGGRPLPKRSAEAHAGHIPMYHIPDEVAWDVIERIERIERR